MTFLARRLVWFKLRQTLLSWLELLVSPGFRKCSLKVSFSGNFAAFHSLYIVNRFIRLCPFPAGPGSDFSVLLSLGVIAV